MSIQVTSALSPEAAKTSILALIKRACEKNTFVDDNLSPDLIKVNYIGDKPGDQNVPPSPAEEPSSTSESSSSSSNSSNHAAVLAAALVPTAIFGAIAAAFIGKGKRNVVTDEKVSDHDYDLQSFAESLSDDSSEDDWYRQPIYGRFNETSEIHDVHKCKSATCELCMRFEAVKFIPAAAGNHLMTIDEGVEDSS